MGLNTENAVRLGILISGGGTTMEKIVGATQPGEQLHGKVIPSVVITSREDAGGIDKAKALGIPVESVRRNDFEKGSAGLEALGWVMMGIFRKYGVDYISQNGWLPLTPGNVIVEYEGRIFNQHPGPLDPDHLGSGGMPLHFGGRGMHGLAVSAAVLEFQRTTGRMFPTEATIHFVKPEMDSGMIAESLVVDVIPGDTPESLARRLLPAEHSLQIHFWNKVSQGSIPEFHRSEPLIRPGEEHFLQEAIIYARHSYPNG
jgi:phosphoribosylglycinamide formyltransferase 1